MGGQAKFSDASLCSIESLALSSSLDNRASKTQWEQHLERERGSINYVIIINNPVEMMSLLLLLRVSSSSHLSYSFVYTNKSAAGNTAYTGSLVYLAARTAS